MKKSIVGILILIVAGLLLFLLIYYWTDVEKKLIGESYTKQGDNSEVEDDLEPSDKVSSSGGGSSTGGGSNAGGGSGESNEDEENPLPTDINEKPCGFYFADYGICVGTCPSGECLVDGKSCYCQLV